MKWLVMLIAVLAVIVFALVRKKMLERRPPPPPDVWSDRTPMGFDVFYETYYANSRVSEPVAFKLVEFLSLSSGIEYKLLRPEDRLDNFPRGSLKKNVVEFAEILVRTLPKDSFRPGAVLFDPRIETVDDFIRKLGPLAEKVEEHHRTLQ